LRRCLEKVAWSVSNPHLTETNEAFAVQPMSIGKAFGLDRAEVNGSEGAISIGQSVDPSGAPVYPMTPPHAA